VPGTVRSELLLPCQRSQGKRSVEVQARVIRPTLAFSCKAAHKKAGPRSALHRANLSPPCLLQLLVGRPSLATDYANA